MSSWAGPLQAYDVRCLIIVDQRHLVQRVGQMRREPDVQLVTAHQGLQPRNLSAFMRRATDTYAPE